MSWTKRQLINKAFGKLGLASYAFDVGNEAREEALSTLDAMMATWNAKGIRINYPLPGSPENSDLDQETEVPDNAAEAIYSNLALRLASDFGKTPSATLLGTAKSTYDMLLGIAAQPREMRFPDTLPAGAGNKSIQERFIINPEPTVVQGPEEYPEFLP